MTKSNTMHSLARVNALVTAAIMAFSSLFAVLALNNHAGAAQLADRFIDMSATQTSEGSGRDGGDAFGQDVTYSVSFELTSAHANIEGIVVDFCSGSPIVGLACTAPAGFNTNFATLGSTLATDDDLNANWAVDTTNSTANTVIITDDTTTGDNLAGGVVVEFDLGTAAAADGFTNQQAPERSMQELRHSQMTPLQLPMTVQQSTLTTQVQTLTKVVLHYLLLTN